MMANIFRIAFVLFFAGSVLLGFVIDYDQYFSFEMIKQQKQDLQALIDMNFIFYYVIFFFIYIIVTTFALPFAALKTILAGALFGFFPGLILTSFASSIGSTLCFLMSRFVLRDTIEKKYKKYVNKINEGVKRDGTYYLFFVRLSPIFPFFIINLAFGLTQMKASTFYIVSQIGMLIGTTVFVNAGVQLAKVNSMKDILSLELILSFILIGLVPLIIKKVIEKNKK